MVLLRTTAGKDVWIRATKLSKEDRAYLETQADAKRSAQEEKRKAFLSKSRRSSKEGRTSKHADYLSKLENEVIYEMNLARTDPKTYVKFLKEHRGSHVGNGVFNTPRGRIQSKEGLTAVDEAIAYLEKVKPVGALKPSKGLSLAAKAHVDDIGPAGVTGHTGTNGSTMGSRIQKQGKWKQTIGENISFGCNTARSIVLQLIIDDGVPSRGHRENIYKGAFKVAGVAYGTHKVYGHCCTIDYAGGFSD